MREAYIQHVSSLPLEQTQQRQQEKFWAAYLREERKSARLPVLE